MIRPATEADASTIAELWLKLVQHHLLLDDAMPMPAADGIQRYTERIRYHLEDTNTRVYVAEDSGVVVGFVLAVIVDLLPEMFEPQRAGFIADIFVLPAHRKQGLGRKLVQSTEKWFQLRGIQYYEWYVAARNQVGRDFWLSMSGRDVMIRMRREIEVDEDQE